MTNVLRRVRSLGQSIWYDTIRRGMIASGDLEHLCSLGVSGLTFNPTTFEKAIACSSDYDGALRDLARAGRSPAQAFEAIALEDIRAAADLLRPVYDRTGGYDGYASIKVSPHLAHDTPGTVEEARRLFASVGRPNVMVTVPATPAGMAAVQRLTGEGINVNVTLIYSLEAYRRVREAYIAGLEALAESGGNLRKVASVASFFVSRVDTAVDGLLEEMAREGREGLKGLIGKAAISNAKLAYLDFKASFGEERFMALRARGARVQRPLWAGTGTKNPSYSDVLYVESLIGPDTVNTMPEATLTAFLEHGVAELTLERDVQAAEQALRALEEAGVDMEQVTAKLLADGVKALAASFDKLLTNIEEKTARLAAQKDKHTAHRLGDALPAVDAVLDDLQARDVMRRIWRRDHTVWKPRPGEIADRLGWLTVTDLMCEQTPVLASFADEVRDSGFQSAVLLGMGGSSLGPEVIRQTLGRAGGYPDLLVLDSIVPAWVEAVTQSIDPGRTLFIVSSKSGSTIEPNVLYKHFRGVVEDAVGRGRAGGSFVAITDPGTPLEMLARKQGFRRVFLNPPDIGGRYSVLSYFGLVPAAVSGVDIAALLDRADCLREGAALCVPAYDNPGARLGALLGGLALQGRDKLTLVTSPSVSSFGLWVEQLIAESTGKGGKGIIPVVGEPLAEPAQYGPDRLFVYLRVEGDDNRDADAAVQRIEAAGQPVARLTLRNTNDLGAEFFRWELATAVAGAVLGVNPFDQPNVQQAKELTERVLAEYRTSGHIPEMASGDAGELLAGARSGDYLAVMVYARQTPEMDRALAQLRKGVLAHHGIATTAGYGPRFLHSTGQLHKGGPDSGIFLQLLVGHGKDLPIPGEPYTFGTLADAQALGDFRALRRQRRRVARVHLADAGPASVSALGSRLG